MSRPGSDLPVVDTGDLDPDPDDGRAVAGVLLAAGTSSRFGGENKLLAEVGGMAMVRRAAASLLESDVDRVVVVVGHEADRVREALDGLDVDVVENPDYRDGQATSVAAGIESVREADAAVFALGDMPHVSPRSVDALVRAYRSGAGDALAAAFGGTRGNPVLFDQRHFDALTAVDGDVGGRDVLLAGDRAALVETDDPGVLRDVDRPADL